MHINKLNIFPTLVYVVNDFLTESQTTDIIQYGKTLEDKHHGCIPDNGTSNHDINYSFIDDISDNLLSCKFVKQNLKDQLDSYSRDSGYSFLQLSNSWINYQYKGSRLTKHTHPNSELSGVIYLNVDDDSSKLYFYNPNQHVYFTQYRERTIYSFDYQWIKPMNGALIVFPSWMSHGSDDEINQSEERVAVSFNTRVL